MNTNKPIDLNTFARNNSALILTGVVFIFVGLLVSIGYYFQVAASSAESQTTLAQTQSPLKSQQLESLIPPPEETRFRLAEAKLKVLEQEQRAEEIYQAQIQEKVDRTLAYLNKRRSPVANETIARIIVDGAEQYNADYRVLLAIMTIESSACVHSFWYNCFGYLNGVKYSSYEQAFSDIVPKVSRQYAAKYGWDFESLSRAYGQHNWELHSKNMRYIANSI